MKVKRGVLLVGLDLKMRPVMRFANEIWIVHHHECVITSGTEVFNRRGKFIHSVNSLHPFGLALDLRTRYFDRYEINSVADELKEQLRLISPAYQVIVEDDHIHVEYDPDCV